MVAILYPYKATCYIVYLIVIIGLQCNNKTDKMVQMVMVKSNNLIVY